MIHYRYRAAIAVALAGVFLIAAIQALAFYLNAPDAPPNYQSRYDFSTYLQIATTLIFLGSIIFSGLALLDGKPARLRRGLLFAVFGAASWVTCSVFATYLIHAHDRDFDNKFFISILTVVASLLLAYLPQAVARIRLRQLNRNGELIRVEKPGGGAPRVRYLKSREDYSAHLGVHWPSAYVGQEIPWRTLQPLYVYRDCDTYLREALSRRCHFVVITGQALSGKTRTAYEAILATRPRSWLVAPRGPDQLLQLVESFMIPCRAIVWLDNLDAFIKVLDDKVTGRLMGLGVTIIGTHSGAQYNIPDEALKIALSRQLSHKEIAHACDIYHEDGRVAEAVKHTEIGLAPYLIGVEHLINRYVEAESARTHQAGRAILRAAVDCRRAGYSEPISDDVLRTLYRHYLGDALALSSFEEGMRWLCASEDDSNVPLLRLDAGGYQALSYFVEYMDPSDDRPVRDEVWAELLKVASIASLLQIGLSALRRQAFVIANQAFARAAHRGDRRAMFNLGAMYHLGLIRPVDETGEMEAAQDWYNQAFSAGDRPAAYVLYRLFIQDGQKDKARTVLKNAGLLSWSKRLFYLASATLGALGGLISPRMRLLFISGARALKITRTIGLGTGGAYVVSPIDAIPDIVPVVGYVDDAVALSSLTIISVAIGSAYWLSRKAPVVILKEDFVSATAGRIDVSPTLDAFRPRPSAVLRQFMRRRLIGKRA